ncbi:MAG: DNA repair protein RecO [Alphaproteobacteria bacterium]|nr:DNA repair protein RecO [Alphaproteobacteria bacterium]
MEWQDIGYIVGLSNFGENDRIVTLLTREHGKQNGYVRGARGTTHRGNWQLGNLLTAKWRARLDSQLGHFSGEIIEQNAAKWLGDRLRLNMMVTACELICRYTPERDPETAIFQVMTDLLRQLEGHEGAAHYLVAYLRFEYAFLALLGYGFDYNLSSEFLSEPENKAPQPLITQSFPAILSAKNCQKILDGLKLSGKYLDRIEQGGSYAAFTAKPMARQRLIDLIVRQQGRM